jgi:hypothetical protein
MSKPVGIQVVGLWDPAAPDGPPRWIGWGPPDRGWRMSWHYRDLLTRSKLGKWFRTLADREPLERVLLGSLWPIQKKAAAKAVSLLRKAYAADPGFLRPSGARRRKVLRIGPGDEITRYPSIIGASREIGMDFRLLWWRCETGEEYEGFTYLAD